MNFGELRFWQYLIAGLGVILLTRAGMKWWNRPLLPRFDKLALLGLGWFLLLCVSWLTFCIFLAVAVGTYFGLQWVLRHPEDRQRHYLWVLIPLQLLPLCYYKYSNFLFNQVLGLQWEALSQLLIPVGISFYTFQKIAFVVDTLHYRKPVPAFLDYLNFASFFPQIVAGPIERRENLLPQMEQFRFRWSKTDLNEGTGWIALGMFFKCCLADNLAAFLKSGSTTNGYLIWLANLLFGLRIYYDFAGYSLVALGLGRCLGIRLTLNFASPYCATSITEFWRRWHITLSQWFRDYLYLPLGGGRTRWWAFNITVVFVVSGIWHGAGWNFVLWGGLHAAFLIANRTLGPKLKIPAPLGWGLTMAGVYLAWLAFYELQPTRLMAKVQAVFTPAAYNARAFHEARASLAPADVYVMGCMLALAASVLLVEWFSLRKRNEPYAYLLHPAVLTVLVALTMLLSPITNNGFIYFAF